MRKVLHEDLDTYIYVDASNIRAACLKTLGMRLDFAKLFGYFKKKYPNLREVRYYEGIATDDVEKEKTFAKLTKIGYQVCALSRKAYVDPAVYREVKCRKCGNIQRVQTLKRSVKLKSNVDVYLASDMLVRASSAKRRVRLVLVSCDGDYAEAIKNMIGMNEKVSVVVVATPPAKDRRNNTLSVRLKQLYREVPLHRYDLFNIETISNYIA